MSDWDVKRNLPPKPAQQDKTRRDDQRYIPRWQIDNRIFYRLDNDSELQEGRSRDLSCAGICLQTEQELLPEQKMKLKVYLSRNKSVDLQGHILWSRKIPQGFLAGIAFDDIKPENQDVILDYAFEIKRSDLVNHWFKGWNP